MEPYTFTWTHMEPFVFIRAPWTHTHVYGAHEFKGVLGFRCIHMESYEPTWTHMQPHGFKWTPTCIHITYVLHGLIWLLTYPYGYIDSDVFTHALIRKHMHSYVSISFWI